MKLIIQKCIRIHNGNIRNIFTLLRHLILALLLYPLSTVIMNGPPSTIVKKFFRLYS